MYSSNTITNKNVTLMCVEFYVNFLKFKMYKPLFIESSILAVQTKRGCWIFVYKQNKSTHHVDPSRVLVGAYRPFNGFTDYPMFKEDTTAIKDKGM